MKQIVTLILILLAIALGATVINSFDAPDTGISGLAWDGTNLWAVDGTTQYAYELDPVNGDVLSSFYIMDQTPTYNPVPGGVIYLNDTLYVTMFDSTLYGKVYKFDSAWNYGGMFDVYC